MTDMPPPPPPGQPQWGGQQQPYQLTPKQLKAAAKAGRPFWQKKRFIIPAVLVAVIVAATAMGGGDDKKTPTASQPTSTSTSSASGAAASKPATKPASKPTKAEPAELYPGRPGAKKDDHEAPVGQSVELSGYTTTVTTAKFVPKLSVIETKGYLVAHMRIQNRDSKPQDYNQFQFKLQTPAGKVIDSTITSADGELGSGSLVKGGVAEGDVVFEVGPARGQFYVLYLPDVFDDDTRGVWGAKI